VSRLVKRPRAKLAAATKRRLARTRGYDRIRDAGGIGWREVKRECRLIAVAYRRRCRRVDLCARVRRRFGP
jgi:hypothetical protein